MKAPPVISQHVEEYLLCILFHFLVPFLPLLMEIIVLGRAEAKTLYLFVAVYTLAIGVSSRSRLLFGLTVVTSLVFSSVFGMSSGNVGISQTYVQIGCACLAVVMLLHAIERFYRHVADREMFWVFLSEGSSSGR